MEQRDPQPAIDLAHHLSRQARARHVSPLKGLQKYIGADMIKLAGGMPDPSYFPFESITVHALAHDALGGPAPATAAHTGLFAWICSFFRSEEKKFSVPKYPAKPGDINLATALQYSPATGIPQIQDFIRDFTARVYKPAYADWQTLIDNGNTDGISRSVSSLCDPGEAILVEEWTYPSMLACALPLGVRTAAIPVDGEGISSVALEKILAEWDEHARGAKRPHVMYTVPIGQNPTGATMGIERKKTIYAICVKYDIVIIEDDPYFFLQAGTWVPPDERARHAALARRIEADPDAFFGRRGGAAAASGDLARAKAALRPAVCADDENERFISSLAPSFVSIDYQGRVVRLDSFSKTIAPGSRLGWITASPQLIERFERYGETASQAPSGLSQALVAQLVAVHWGAPRFLAWLRGLRAQYAARRDACVDALCAAFDVHRDADPAAVAAFGAGVRPWVYTAHLKRRGGGDDGGSKLRPRVFSFIPPSSGMFIWVKFHVRDSSKNKNKNSGDEKSKESLEQRLWIDLAENGLLIVPGWCFSPSAAGEIPPATGADEEDARFRISFSLGSDENMKKGIDVLAKVLEHWVTE